MPIYAYRCAECGFEKDYLQKMSDPVLTECPQCNKSTFAKQLTAAGFQLKGSGWYATDFKGGVKPGDKASADNGKLAAADGAAKEGTAKEGGAKEGGAKEAVPAKETPAKEALPAATPN